MAIWDSFKIAMQALASNKMRSAWDSFKMAVQALASNKMRSALTMLGVIIGVSAVVLLVSIGLGVRSDISAQILGLGPNLVIVLPADIGLSEEKPTLTSFGSMVSKLTWADAKDIEKEATSIAEVTPSITRNITIRFRNKSRITTVNGVGANYTEVMAAVPERGTFINETHVRGAKRVCVLGKTVVDDLLTNIDPIGQRVTLADQKYTVIGVMEEKGQFTMVDQDDVVLVPISSAMELTGLEQLSYILAKAKDPHNMDNAVAEVESILGKRYDKNDFSVTTQQEMVSLFQGIMDQITLMLAGIGAISLTVGGIGIMNIMLVAVTERTREIGIRKAVGATRRDILLQFLIEAIILSVAGGAIGLAVSVAICQLMSNILPTQITLWTIAVAFTVAVAVGVVFGVYPARKASRLDPIVALGYE